MGWDAAFRSLNLEQRLERYKRVAKSDIDWVTITTKTGRQEVFIPARLRDCSWGILRFMLLHHDRKVTHAELCRGVKAIMEEFAPEQWERFVQKTTVSTLKKKQVIRKQASPWRHRLVLNAENLCRIRGPKSSGKRLVEQGQVLRYTTTPNGVGYFILFTSLTPGNLAKIKRGRKQQPPLVKMARCKRSEERNIVARAMRGHTPAPPAASRSSYP